MKEYFQEISNRVQSEFNIAKQARKNGFDFSPEPEIYVAKDLADKVEGLVELSGLAEKIRKFKKESKSDEEVAFKLVKAIIEGEQDKEIAADHAVRAGLAYLTQGAVAAPLEGIAKIKIKKNPDDTNYLAIYYAGPIRAAGGTAEALSVVLADYIRKVLGLHKYQPNLSEIGRYNEEIQWYHRHVHLQYYPNEKEIETIVRNLPVCIDGEPTEEYEVSNYRDLGRVETNRVRGGMCLVLAEGIAQKAPKLLKRLKPLEKEYGLDWSWLSELTAKKEEPEPAEIAIEKDSSEWEWLEEPEETEEKTHTQKYLQEIPAGRPVFSHPSKKGGFSLRYGRTRASGYAAVAVSPATMHILDDFIAIGTQIRLEHPGKAAIVTPCDSIDGPTIKLKDGEVLQINTTEEAEKYKPQLEEILHLGDILISAGDFLENNHQFLPSSYCVEWWAQELKQKTQLTKDPNLNPFLNPPYETPALKTAFEISKKYNIPLHPKYTFFWDEINGKHLLTLVDSLMKAKATKNGIKLSKDETTKKILEKLGVSHKIEDDSILIGQDAPPLLATLHFTEKTKSEIEDQFKKTKNIFEILSNLCGVKIKNKAPTRIGARMGRPEKAKPRKMTPAPHVLFPTGGVKGRIRNIVKLSENPKQEKPELAKLKCTKCGSSETYSKCTKCGSRTELVRVCPLCGRTTPSHRCPSCSVKTTTFEKREINFEELLNKAATKLNEEIPKEIKGILGMSSKEKIPEPIEKGFLRAKENIYVFKDGTTRFDATNTPLTHFKPKEAQVSVSKLKSLGYTHDTYKKPLKTDDQTLELKPQDILISDFGEVSGVSYLLSITKFVDELLEKYYKLKPYYNAKKKEDLIGQLVIALAPHTSTGIVGRIIGFTKARVGFAHPCFHDAKRRDCDGDEDAVILLLDALLNFSRSFLPEKRGGRMDAPLVISTELNPLEIDDEVYDLDIANEYSLSFYEATEKFAEPNEIKLKTVGSVVHSENPFDSWAFTHKTSDINNGPLVNTYSEGKMVDKLKKQLDLAEKIRAVNAKDVAERIINTHFIPDIKGNLRTFSRQKVRCTKCNTKYRRPPLTGTCTNCGGNLTLTVHKGTIKKYLEVSKEMVEKYKISKYIGQQIELMDKNIISIFGEEQETMPTQKQT